MRARVVFSSGDYTVKIWSQVNGWMSVAGYTNRDVAIERAREYARGPHVVWEGGVDETNCGGVGVGCRGCVRGEC